MNSILELVWLTRELAHGNGPCGEGSSGGAQVGGCSWAGEQLGAGGRG